MNQLFKLLPVLFLGAGSAQSQTAPSEAAPQPPSLNAPFPARLSDVEGPVQVAQLPPETAQAKGAQLPPAPPPDSAFHSALVNTPVLAGTEVQTGHDGRAELQFNDGNIARMAPNSAVAVLALPEGGEELRVMRGLSYLETNAEGTGTLTVQAGPDGVRLSQGSLVRFDLDRTPLQIGVLRGSAQFTSASSDIGFEVSNGQTAAIDPSDSNSYDVNGELANNSWDAWNTDRDQTIAELAQGETNARVGNGDANSPGWNDLDYYGTWYNVPGAGMAWAPDGVDASFDPYGSGAWTSYPGVGPTWVSAYPWGWLPYHCGGWNYFSGFGWGWQPGGCGYGGAGWYPYSGVHNGPPGYRLPTRHPVRKPVQTMDARLQTQPVPVTRGPVYSFRPLGGARPEPRPFPIAPSSARADRDALRGGGSGFAPTLPVNVGGLGGRSPYLGGGALPSQHPEAGRGVYTSSDNRIVTRGPNAITPPGGVLAAPRTAITPPVRVVPPPVFHPAPPPAAPRMAAPAAASPAAPRSH